MMFSKLTWRALGAAAAAALAVGAAPAAGAAVMTATDGSCVLTVSAAERPFVAEHLTGAHATPVAESAFQYEVKAADVPALKATVSRDESDARSTKLHFLLGQCADGRPGAASLEPGQPSGSVPEARSSTAVLNTTVTLGSIIFGSLPTLIDVLW